MSKGNDTRSPGTYRPESSCPAWWPLAVCDYVNSFKWTTCINGVSRSHVPELNVQWLSVLGDHSVDSPGLECLPHFRQIFQADWTAALRLEFLYHMSVTSLLYSKDNRSTESHLLKGTRLDGLSWG